VKASPGRYGTIVHPARGEHRVQLPVRNNEAAAFRNAGSLRGISLKGRAVAGPFHEESTMQINVKGHQVEVTASLHDYAVAKFERITRHFDHLHELAIVLGIEKVLHKAEATMLLSGKKLHADATATDMYAAIDALVDKVDVQVRKHKEKLTDHHADAVRAARYS
jgi:putative sigma-54 modulation protein